MKHRGFTLTELLVTLAITITLTALSLIAFRAVRDRAHAAIEVNAARNLIAGYLLRATEHHGRVMPGYQSEPGTTNLDGESLDFPLNARYPWRLAPYVPKLDGVMLFNGNESAIQSPDRDYLVSVQPNLGLNAVLVGGHFGTGSPLPPSDRLIERLGKFHLTHLSEASRAENLIVFASARAPGENGKAGYFEVRPPNLLRANWTGRSFSRDLAPSAHGFVDFRWRDRAVVATIGGGVELLDESGMRDMRRWSIQAAEFNDHDFIIGRQ